MINALRGNLAQKIVSALKQTEYTDPTQLAACLTLRINKGSASPLFSVPLKCMPLETLVDCPKDDQLHHFAVEDKHLHVKVEPRFFTSAVIRSVLDEKRLFGLTGDIHKYYLRKDKVIPVPQNQNVLIEFSSPNIAKPFHAGHLRSTIIGSVIANVYEALGHNVTRINYLGDWGTQFGLLAVAFQRYGSLEKLEQESIKHLFEIYVRINREVEQEKSDHGLTTIETPTFIEGKRFFKQMEEGEPEAIRLWSLFRKQSINEYKTMYERLGVKFDSYEGESMYQKQSEHIIDILRQQNLLVTNKDTGVGYVDLTEYGTGKHLPASLLKSDGTTLYLTRDLAAVIDRFAKYNFDKLHYVVENGQHLHFFQLLHILKKMGVSWSERCGDDFHVKFGRVEGMSTRRGEVVFLKDILDEAQGRMEQSMRERLTTKVSGGELSRVSDLLGVSAIIIQDLHASRLKNYKFSWERMLNFKADSGIFLQYAHARLCSLEENCGVPLNPECDVSYLIEPEAMRLTIHLARYDEAVRDTLVYLEPYILVKYLCRLGHLINSANSKLTVKGETTVVAQARLALFHCSRTVMANGLRLLGIKPVTKM